MSDTHLVIPARDEQVCFNMRQATGNICDAHATLLGESFTAAIVMDAHPAFVKSVFDQLSLHYIKEMFNNPVVKAAIKDRQRTINQSYPESESKS